MNLLELIKGDQSLLHTFAEIAASAKWKCCPVSLEGFAMLRQ
jgi:hypothetical protein